jgi:hypothetical protein
MLAMLPEDEAVSRLAGVLGGGEDDPPVPSLTGGAYEMAEPAGADTRLQTAMVADLTTRLHALVALARQAADDIVAIAPAEPDAAQRYAALTAPWGFAPQEALDPVTAGDPEISPDALRLASAAMLRDRADTAAAVVAEGTATVNGLRRAIRALAGHRHLPVLPVVERALLPVLRTVDALDVGWLEVVAAVRPRLAALEAQQLDPMRPDWPAAVAAPEASTDPWHPSGPVVVAYGPAVATGDDRVAVTALDAWTDSVPSRRHTTAAAFGFNAPKSRAPQAVLLAVPPDPSERLSPEGLLDVVLGTRELAHARGAGPADRDGLPYATPATLVHGDEPLDFFVGWP